MRSENAGPNRALHKREINGLSWFELAVCVFGIAMGCVGALYFWSGRGSLWEDEIIAITHANQPLPAFFAEVLRNDIHPPFYFLQLDAWLAIGANNDRWALTNSLVWALISLFTIFSVARSAHGRRAAWFATAIFAVLPSFAWSAGTLRMYALIPALVLLAYHANRRWLATGLGGWLAAAFALEIVLVCTHAIEFYFVAFIAFCVLIEAAAEHGGGVRGLLATRGVKLWWIAQCAVAVIIVLIAASALLRGSDASAPESFRDLIAAPGTLVAGWKFSSYAFARIAGLVIFAILIVAGLAEGSSRARTLIIPLGALMLAMVVGVLLKPMIKQPVFAANLLPFLALGAGAGAALGKPSIRLAVIVCIVSMAIFAVPIAREQAQGEAFEPAARYLTERVRPGDVVVIPNVSVYWGILRYAVGSDWGRPLETMSEPNAQWRGLFAKIDKTFGATTANRLGLRPKTNLVESRGVRYMIGQDARRETANASRVWIVKRDRYEVNVLIDAKFETPIGTSPGLFGDGELSVHLFEGR